VTLQQRVCFVFGACGYHRRTMKIAVLGGTGKEGSGLALRWAHAGHAVIIGSRDATRAQQAAEELNLVLGDGGASTGLLSGMENLAASQAAEVVVLSVPYTAHAATIEGVKDALAGKVVIDVTVPMNPANFMTAMVPPGGSASKEAQALLPNSKVVTAFQNISAAHLKKLDAAVHCDVLVCGDDDAAKAIGLQLVADAGMKGYDAGPLDNAVAVESLTPVLLYLNKKYKIKGSGIKITGA
jgi:hypothetical protein